MWRILDRVFSPVFDKPADIVIGTLFKVDEKVHHVNLTKN